MAEIDKKAAEMVTKAVAAIVMDDPFFGYLLLRNEVIPDLKIKHTKVANNQISYNPTWIRQQSLPKVIGALKHDVLHMASMHHLRRQNRDKEMWDEACDHVVNNILLENNTTLPDNYLANPKYKDFSAEHIYSLIQTERNGGGGGGGENDGDGEGDAPSAFKPWNFGAFEDSPNSNNEAALRQEEEDMKQDVIQAHNAAKMMGKVPAGIERMVDQARESKMPWRRILQRFFRATSKADYSWLKPNRRFLAHDLYLPSLHSEGLGPVVIGVDTSGSVGGPELEQFFGCINGILRHTRPEAVHVVYCDSRVANTQVFRPDEYPLSMAKFKPKGGGGTAFEPVFDYVKEKKLKPVVLLYLTDMYGSFPDKAPPYPTIWCATSSIKGPFGKTLEIS